MSEPLWKNIEELLTLIESSKLDGGLGRGVGLVFPGANRALEQLAAEVRHLQEAGDIRVYRWHATVNACLSRSADLSSAIAIANELHGRLEQ